MSAVTKGLRRSTARAAAHRSAPKSAAKRRTENAKTNRPKAKRAVAEKTASRKAAKAKGSVKSKAPKKVIAKRKTASKRAAAPKPHNKRVWANIEKDMTSSIAEMFDEVQRRDPSNSRTKVVLLDGDDRQSRLVQEEARARNVRITIVLDIIHVLHYLWQAGFALCKRNEAMATAWVATYLFKLLTRQPEDVAAGIRQCATLRGLTLKQRGPVDRCAKYLHDNGLYLRYGEFLAQGRQ